MNKITKLIVSLISFVTIGLISVSCVTDNNESETQIKDDDKTNTNDDSDNNSVDENRTLELSINNVRYETFWLDNESVKGLKRLSTNDLVIFMSRYNDFEQVGDIGHTLPSSDIETTAKPGDIMLYQSNKICIFYGENTYRYTKLGHINISSFEIADLLGDRNAFIKLSLK